ncbi:MAG: putative dimethyl sulfoxide reductase chain YnfF [Alphaproteobacteria bacterium MarineAlpha11_Bin1]|nr:MAG: putative dimethyl sulfoxide reductase chain YnfF [Alphaproteobacteria bacterium MarineAlpha11_Bin1]|tara:strand:- start:6188 stop:8251 length:2064 start_codon:yes stop_codon:yes gene_type:complete
MKSFEIAHSVCPHDCASACTLDIEVESPNKIGRVHGSDENTYTAGVVCAKVARYAERVHHPARLKQPMRRKGTKSPTSSIDDFEPLSWDSALDIVAENYTKATQRYGSETVWLYNYAGTMGKVQRDGIQGLRNAMGYSRQHNTICSSIMLAGMVAGIGAQRGCDPREFGEADLIVVWGGNPVYTQINLMTHISRARKERGAKLIVIDPYKTPTARQADVHLRPRPGTDAALACAVMHVLFRDGYADQNYMTKFTNDAAALEHHLQTRDPDWAAKITGITVYDIEALAKDYGNTDRAIIRMGYGFSRSRNGASSLHAVSCLPAIKGAWRFRGGGLYGSVGQNFNLNTSLVTGVDDPNVRQLDMSRLGPILNDEAEPMAGGPPVTAMLVQSSNPAVVAPESGKVRAGLMKSDMFLCVHEQFLTDTAKLADIVLPATTFLEHDDIYSSYGHPYLQMGPKILEPLGEARSNHDMLAGLSSRLGADHRAFEMSAWDVIDEVLQTNGLGSAKNLKEKRFIEFRPSFEESHFLNGFPHPDGKFRFRADWSAQGPDHTELPDLPDYCDIVDVADEARPFRLVTAPSRNYLNTSFTETETSIVNEDQPTILLNTADCDDLGVTDGERVRIGNDLGELVLFAQPFDGLERGVAVVESIWPNQAFEGGIGINLLTSADPAKPNGGAVFHDTAVWVRST